MRAPAASGPKSISSAGGATRSDLQLLRKHLPDETGIQASGAADLDEALELQALGCSRIATTATAPILDAWKQRLAPAANPPDRNPSAGRVVARPLRHARHREAAALCYSEFFLQWRRRGRSRAFASRWACQTFQPCWSTPGAKPRRAKLSWNFAWTSWTIRCKGAEAIRRFLEQFPDCIVLATCRRHQNHGKFNGSIEEQFAILDLAVRNGAHAIDVEIETAEVAAGPAAASSAGAPRSSSRITISKPRRPWTR